MQTALRTLERYEISGLEVVSGTCLESVKRGVDANIVLSSVGQIKSFSVNGVEYQTCSGQNMLISPDKNLVFQCFLVDLNSLRPRANSPLSRE